MRRQEEPDFHETGVTDGGAARGIFDGKSPPSAVLARDCVHCGFCLPACPTYVLWGKEMDSPRGRIHLIAQGLAGHGALDRTMARHFDSCLGCLACVTACPSGVAYEPLLLATRGQIERHVPRSPGDRWFRAALLTVLSSRPLLRVAALAGWFYQRLGVGRVLARLGVMGRLPGRLRVLVELQPRVSLAGSFAMLPEQIRSRGPTRLRVGFLAGCVQSVFFARVNRATVEVLAAEGCEVLVPEQAGCCGALAAHTGADDQARDLVCKLIRAFDDFDVDRIVVNAAGCGASLRHCDRLFEDDPVWRERAREFACKVCDVMELVAELQRESRSEFRAIAVERVAYHDACHLSHGQGIRAAPRQVLARIPGLAVLEIPEGDLCCGSAGLYNLTEPEAASELGQRKAENIRRLAPEVVAAGNPGCLLQLGRHLADDGIALVHPIELVARSMGVPGFEPR